MKMENAMFSKVFARGARAVRARFHGASASGHAAQKDPVLASPPPTSRPRFARGFTLLEMLAVIVLLGIVATIVARSISGSVTKADYKAGKLQVQKLSQDIDAYMLDNGSPPKELQDLLSKPGDAPSWNGPYAKAGDLKDPWGHPFAYTYPGQHGQYDIVFYGRDGKPGGEGVDADYGNWQQ